MCDRRTEAPTAGLFQWQARWLSGILLWLLMQSPWAAPPQRIVTLTPHAAELVCAAGSCDRLVGVVEHTDFPPRLQHLPRIGRYDRFDLETLILLKPDLIIGWRSGTPPALVDRLRQLGFTVWLSNPIRLEDIPAEIETLGRMLGTESVATRHARILRGQLNALRQRFQAHRRLKVFYQIWDAPLMTIGGRQFIARAITLCGGRNLFDDLPTPAGAVSLEALLTRAPEVILLGGNDERQRQWQQRWQAWPDLPAVRHGLIFPMPADLLQRPGPRLIAGTAVLCHTLEKARQTLAQSATAHPPAAVHQAMPHPDP